uniref:Uncharacterized protein n=1 Tax=Cacopsylla melanoneura TaxID=428564 RepID=A0A8D8VPC1_9HEMI
MSYTMCSVPVMTAYNGISAVISHFKQEFLLSLFNIIYCFYFLTYIMYLSICFSGTLGGVYIIFRIIRRTITCRDIVYRLFFISVLLHYSGDNNLSGYRLSSFLYFCFS